MRRARPTATSPARCWSATSVPVRCGGRLFGYLWLIDEERTLTDGDLQMATDAAAASGQIMHRELLALLRGAP